MNYNIRNFKIKEKLNSLIDNSNSEIDIDTIINLLNDIKQKEQEQNKTYLIDVAFCIYNDTETVFKTGIVTSLKTLEYKVEITKLNSNEILFNIYEKKNNTFLPIYKDEIQNKVDPFEYIYSFIQRDAYKNIAHNKEKLFKDSINIFMKEEICNE